MPTLFVKNFIMSATVSIGWSPMVLRFLSTNRWNCVLSSGHQPIRICKADPRDLFIKHIFNFRLGSRQTLISMFIYIFVFVLIVAHTKKFSVSHMRDLFVYECNFIHLQWRLLAHNVNLKDTFELHLLKSLNYIISSIPHRRI